MLTEKDIASLKRHETLVGKTVDWIVAIVPMCLIVLADINLQIAAKIGGDVGYGLGALVGVWLDGVDPDTLYSGTFLIALDLFKSAVVELAAAVVLAIMALGYHRTRATNLRVLAQLRQAGKV
jgi:hypothetical protein